MRRMLSTARWNERVRGAGCSETAEVESVGPDRRAKPARRADEQRARARLWGRESRRTQASRTDVAERRRDGSAGQPGVESCSARADRKRPNRRDRWPGADVLATFATPRNARPVTTQRACGSIRRGSTSTRANLLKRRRGHSPGADHARLPVTTRLCMVRDDAMTVTVAV